MSQNQPLELMATFRWPEHSAQYVAPVLNRLAEASRLEDGCWQFELYFATPKAGAAIAVERWADRDSWEKHLSDTAVANAKQEFKKHKIEVEIKMLEPIARTSP